MTNGTKDHTFFNWSISKFPVCQRNCKFLYFYIYDDVCKELTPLLMLVNTLMCDKIYSCVLQQIKQIKTTTARSALIPVTACSNRILNPEHEQNMYLFKVLMIMLIYFHYKKGDELGRVGI